MSRGTGESGCPPEWRRNLYVVWGSELVAIAGLAVTGPLLPLYVRQLGVQGEQEVRLWAGIIVSIHAIPMAAFGPIWGALSDRYGRKVMITRAMLGGALTIAMMGLVQNVQQLVLLRILQGAVSDVVSAANTLVAASAPRERAGHALGLLMVSVYVGASVGPLLGGVTADSIGYRAAFGIAGVLLALGGLAVLIFVRERFQSVTPPEGGKGSGKRSWLSLSYWRRSAMAVALGSAPLLALLVMRLLSRLGERATVPVLPLFVESIASADTRVASFTGLISGVAAAAAAVGALFLGRLGDRWGHWKILAVCGLVALACYGCHIFVAAPGWLLPLQAGAGLAIGGMVASINAAVARTAPQGQEGTVYGLLGSAVCTANALGPMAGSAVAAWLGLRMSFLLAAGCFALAAAVAIYRLDQRLP